MVEAEMNQPNAGASQPARLHVLALAAEAAERPDVLAAIQAGIAAGGDALSAVPPPARRELAAALMVLADTSLAAGIFDVSHIGYLLAGELYEELDGPESPSMVSVLSNAAMTLLGAGQPVEGESCATLAWQLAEKLAARGEPLAGPAQARVLVNLGLARARRGRLDEAAAIYRRAVPLCASSDDQELRGVLLNNLGALEVQRGRVADAQALLREALHLRRSVHGPDDPAVADTLMNLGALAERLRRWSPAGSMFEAALAIRQAAWPGHDHPLTAQAMSSVANARFRAGDTESARSLGNAALAIRERLFAGHPSADLAESLNNVASLDAAGGRLDDAIRLWRRARDVLVRALGYDNERLALCLSNLALAHAAAGQLQQARPAAQQAVLVAERALGPRHPALATYHANNSWVQAMSGDRGRALVSVRKARAVEANAYWRVVRMSTAHDRLAFAGGVRDLGDASLSMILASGASPASAELTEAADLVLQRKRVDLDTKVALRRALDVTIDREVAEVAGVLREARAELARLQMSGPSGRPASDHEEQLFDAALAVGQSEEALARRLDALDLGPQLAEASWTRVRDALPDDAALVDIVQFQPLDLRPGAALGSIDPPPKRYLAVVVRPGTEPPAVVLLSAAPDIDQMVDAFRTAVITGDSEVGVGVALAGELVAPIQPHLHGVTRLFLAPDGDLFELPFDALPLADGRRLADLWEITYLATGRELLGDRSTGRVPPGPSVVLGDPDFALSAGGPDGPPPAFGAAQLNVERLEYTRREAEQVARILGVDPLLAGAARKGVLKRQRSPRVMHLATHGYFLPAVARADDGFPPASTVVRPDDLLRSGLLLAGARTWRTGGRPPADAEDGVLTAADVEHLDLRGTELVVLSACESGLGVVHTGEGVQGLRSSFHVAGAAVVVMSLWQVGDEITSKVMSRFYDALGRGVAPARALRTAQQALRAEYPDAPFAWAAFVCQGFHV
jgi:CHAT domain-containing protein